MALFIVERVGTGFTVRNGDNTLQAAASALTAEAWAATAEAAQLAAEEARLSAQAFAGLTYASQAAGEAGTTNGQEFKVATGGVLYVYRRTVSGSTLLYTVIDGLALNSAGGAALVGLAQGGKIQDAVDWAAPISPAGNWNGTQAVAGTGTDDTAKLQATITAALIKGREIVLPAGRFRTTAPIQIDLSALTTDPIDGGITGLTIRGAGAGRTQIVADHNGTAFEFKGGTGAGWHTFTLLHSFSVLKANYGKNAGSKGLSFNSAAFLCMENFSVEGFEYGIYGLDVLSARFANSVIRLNDKGFYFAKGTQSYPNSITFDDVRTLNNTTYGGYVVRPSLFRYRGGSIESNGYTGTLADTNSWGLKVENAGVEGAVGVVVDACYAENNNGKADVWIVQTIGVANHLIVGTSFMRFKSARYVTQNLLVDATTDTKVTVAGCGFKDLNDGTGSPYVSSSARPFIASGNAQIMDGGGNSFYDTAGGFTGVLREVFAPINVHHQLQYSALPDAAKHRNGIMYSQDGGGGSSRPALMVSDGTKWWPIVLGQFAGSVKADGTANALPRGWAVAKTGTGIYVVTHNLNITGTQYAVTAARSGLPGQGRCDGFSKSNNSFEVYTVDAANALADRAFDFHLNVI